MAFDQLDKIHIRDLLLRTIIGVYEEERRDAQDITLNLTLHTDLQKAGVSDKLADTVDYKALKKRIKTYVEATKYNLIECLAEEVATLCLENPRVERVEVTVDKPGALRFARSVAVSISRTRKDVGTMVMTPKTQTETKDATPMQNNGRPALPPGMQEMMEKLLEAKGIAPPSSAVDTEIETVTLPDTPPDGKVLIKVPLEIAREYQFVPLAFSADENRLQAAFSAPPNARQIEVLRWSLHCEIEPRLADAGAIEQAMQTWYEDA